MINGTEQYEVKHNNNLAYSTTKVLFKNTTIVEFNHKAIHLNNGGWFTASTKQRMNKASKDFNLRFEVYQKDYVWYCNYDNKIFSFTGNILNLPRIS